MPKKVDTVKTVVPVASTKKKEAPDDDDRLCAQCAKCGRSVTKKDRMTHVAQVGKWVPVHDTTTCNSRAD